MPRKPATTARLKAARQRAGLTQVELAKRLGITQATYSDFERGRTKASLDWLNRAAEALGCKLSELAEIQQ